MFERKKSNSKADDLRDLLLMQKCEQLNDNKRIWDFATENFFGKEFGGKSVSTDYVILNLMNEWKSMFSYSPGFKEGIDIIVLLLDFIIKNQVHNVLTLYNTNEWRKIAELRGPAETVLEKECNYCNNLYISMCMSGFIEGIGLVCNKCGNVYFRSVYDESKVPICECGGNYTQDCPFCGRNDSMSVKEISPYLYFSNHKYIRANGF